VIPAFLNDRVKARELQPDGTYRRLRPEGAEPRRQAQWQFREVSRERMKKLGGSTKKARADRLVPIAIVQESGAPTPTKSETK
jgi:polyphosphate kinase